MKVKTRDLQPGDVLSSGETIERRPYPETHPAYGRNKMRVTLRHSNPNAMYNVETRVWGADTTINVISRQAWPKMAVADLVAGGKYEILGRDKTQGVEYTFRGFEGDFSTFASMTGVVRYPKNMTEIPVKAL